MTEFHLRRPSSDNNRSMVRSREKPTKVNRRGVCVASEFWVIVIIVNHQPPRVLGMIQPPLHGVNHFVKFAILVNRTQPARRRMLFSRSAVPPLQSFASTNLHPCCSAKRLRSNQP